MAELKDTIYLSLDPGEATGWACFDTDAEIISMGTCWSLEELVNFLNTFPGKPKVVIYENYRLMKRKAMQQSGSEMPASVAIGAIKTHAILWGSRLVKQEASIKPMAEMMSGFTTKGMSHKHTHQLDAANHGVYYLVRNRLRKSIGEKQIEQRKNSKARNSSG